MENASKALIIAGAILLAILIIGLGMLIFNQAKDQIGRANLDQDTINALNSKFDNYIGDNVRGSNVKTLCNTVRDNNLTADESTTFSVKLTFGTDKDVTDATEINKIRSKIGNGKYYDVTCTYDSKTKLIDSITITEAGSSSSGTVTE